MNSDDMTNAELREELRKYKDALASLFAAHQALTKKYIKLGATAADVYEHDIQYDSSKSARRLRLVLKALGVGLYRRGK